MTRILRAGVATLLAGSLVAAAPAANALASPSKDGRVQIAASDKQTSDRHDPTKHDASLDRRRGERADPSKDARDGSGSRDSTNGGPGTTKR